MGLLKECSTLIMGQAIDERHPLFSTPYGTGMPVAMIPTYG